jgi:hypothetical protein
MRRIFLLLMASMVSLTGIALAAPAYGTKMPQKKEAFWGLEHYYIKGRNLDNGIGNLKSRQNHLLLSYGLADWFSLDLKWSLYSDFEHEGGGSNQVEFENPVWGGGYGFRIRLYEKGPVKAVAGFQHISIHPKTLKANGIKETGILDDWQYSALVSYAFKRFTPYTGVRYAMLDHIREIDDGDRNRMRSDDDRRFGWVTGLDVPVSDKVWINLEADWQDGGSYTTGLHFRF